MNIEHKIWEILRAQPDRGYLTAKQIFDAGQFENLTVIQALLGQLANKPAACISRIKVLNPEGKNIQVWAYFSTDKNAPPVAHSTTTMSEESSIPAAKDDDDAPQASPKMHPTSTISRSRKFHLDSGGSEYSNLDDAIAAAKFEAERFPGTTVEVQQTIVLHRFRATIEVKELT